MTVFVICRATHIRGKSRLSATGSHCSADANCPGLSMTKVHLLTWTACACLALPSSSFAQNYYAQQNIAREHQAYIDHQMEVNTRYYKNSGSSDAPTIKYVPAFSPPEPAYERTEHLREEWERQQYARAHPLETGLAAYLASQKSSPPPRQQTPAEYAGQVKALAEAGDVEAKEAYANCLYNGFGVAVNLPEAYRVYREAAALRPAAEMQAAGMLIDGKGVPKNVPEGLALMKHAAAAGDAYAATYMMSMDGTYSPDTVEASARQGDFDPMMRLGLDYEEGKHGRDKDFGKAFGYLKRAAEGGSPRAMVFLGDMYENGEGIPVDHAQAISWYLKADAAGDDTAPAEISAFYRAHGGATSAETMKWAQKAVSVNPVARSYLELGALQLSQGDEASARQNFAKAAELGSRQGIGLTGIYEWRGVAGPRDAVSGYRHLVQAAEMGDARALNELGEAYRDGNNDVPVDAQLANAFFEKSAETGYKTAQYNMALAYWSGIGVAQSYEQAGFWALKAAAQDQADAQYMMALLTQAGIGGVKDPGRAVEWMNAAAANGSELAKTKLAAGFDGT